MASRLLSRRGLAIVAGLVLSVVFMFLALRQMEWHRVREAIANAELYPWLLLSVLSYLAGHLVRGVRTRALVSGDAQLGLFSACNVVVLGYAVNNILPARMGELARAGMLSERTGVPFASSLSLTFLERVLDGAIILLIAVVAAPHVGAGSWVGGRLVWVGLLFGAALLGVLAFVLAPELLSTYASRLAGRVRPRWHDPAVRLTFFIGQGVAYLRRPLAALWAVLLTVGVWLLEGGLFFWALPALGVQADPWLALFAMAITNLGILIPSSPGFVGTFHYFCIGALTLAGVAEPQAVSVAFVVHLTFYIPITLWGVAIIFGYGIELSSMIKVVRRAKRLAPPDLPVVTSHLATTTAVPTTANQPAPPSRFFQRLIEATVPAPLTDPAQAQQVNDEVARFVEGQLGALPTLFRLAFAAGMRGFRMHTVLRTCHSFCALPLQARTAQVERWAYGRFALGRQLFRVVRSTALLAYYEHPLVTRALGLEEGSVAPRPALAAGPK